MKKNSSCGSLLTQAKSRPSSKYSYISNNLNLRPVSATNQTSKKINYSLINNKLNRKKSSSFFPSLYPTISNEKNTISNENSSQLYIEVLQLKKNLNSLKLKINLLKTEKVKKELEIQSKEKKIENYLDSGEKDNINGLVDLNSISHLKREYLNLKKELKEKNEENQNLKNSIKNIKLNQELKTNENLRKNLINLINEYQNLNELNNNNFQEINNLKELKNVFENNHKNIQELKNILNLKKKNIEKIKKQIENLNKKHLKNNKIIKKQNFSKILFEQKNQKILNEKKNKEKFLRLKSTYEKKIENLSDILKNLKSKHSNIENDIKSYSEKNQKLKEENSIDKAIIKKFNFQNIVSIQKPNFKEDTKILLLKSLINESYKKRKKYIKQIEEYIENLKNLGFDASLIDDFDNNNGYISERNLIEKSKSNSDININKENINFDNENKLGENSFKDIKINDKKIEDFDSNKNFNNIENENNSEKKENNSEKKEINDNNNNKNDLLNLMSNDDFTEFTYVLIKNFEAKKITEELAKAKLISPSPLPTIQDFITQFTNNISIVLNTKHSESLEKIKKWINTLLNMCNNDQQKTNENFLSLFSNVKIYSSDKELILNKKVKKYLLPFKEQLSSKLKDKEYISFIVLKQIIEELKIDIKDDYIQFLFYYMKQFSNNDVNLYDVKVQNLFDILNNNQNDSKMNTESDIEISNDEYISIITNFINNLNNYLHNKNTNIKTLLKDITETVQAEGTNDKLSIILIEPFINKMKEIGIEIKSELEVYCIFSRYKISDDYEVISLDLLEKEIENFNLSKINNQIKGGESVNRNSNNIDEKVIEDITEENEGELEV